MLVTRLCRFVTVIKPAMALLLLSGCIGDNHTTHTTLYEDGSVERTISTIHEDSSVLEKNIFGIHKQAGWTTDVQGLYSPPPDSALISQQQYRISFTKWFKSAEEANEMLLSPDALLKIQSHFETSFRWFYSDLYYSDTYLAVFQFENVNPDDFFTAEDYAFMEHSKKTRSKADSAHAGIISQKLEAYAMKGILEEEFNIVLKSMEHAGIERRWMDSTWKYKKEILRTMTDNFRGGYLETFFEDSLHIPFRFPKGDLSEFEALPEKYAFAFLDGFEHSIKMPFPIVASNADSTAGMYAFWNPNGALVKDFTMHVKSRRVNYIAIMATIFLLAALVFILRIRESIRITRNLGKRA